MLYLGQADCWKNKNNAKPVTKVFVSGTSYTNPAISLRLKSLKHNWSVNLMPILSQISWKIFPTTSYAVPCGDMPCHAIKQRNNEKFNEINSDFTLLHKKPEINPSANGEEVGSQYWHQLSFWNTALWANPAVELDDGRLNLFRLCSLFTTAGLYYRPAWFHRWMHSGPKEKAMSWGKERRSEEIKTVVLKCRWMISHLNSLQTPTTHFLCIQ